MPRGLGSAPVPKQHQACETGLLRVCERYGTISIVPCMPSLQRQPAPYPACHGRLCPRSPWDQRVRYHADCVVNPAIAPGAVPVDMALA
jgi:hypothetical protein